MSTSINTNKVLGSTSGTSITIGNVLSPPVNTVAPVISGSTPVGSTLTTTDGTWTGSPTFTYQWYRGATLITSATTATYVTVTADTGLAVTCQVTGTNPAGSAIGISNSITPTAVVTPFAFTANTNNTSAGSSTATQFKLPLTTSSGLNIVVDWGDATTSTITNHLDAAVTHTYASAGTYSISITGTLPGWQYNNTGDRLKILNISSWGILNITTNVAFYGCTNLISNATDAPTITTTDLSQTFRSCTNFNGNIGSWNVSAVNNLTFMFFTATAFNNGGSSSIGTWNTSAVTNMTGVFVSASAFNQNISSWNTAAVTIMASMFQGCNAFNQNISSWNTGLVTSMSSMFLFAAAFNQPIGSWNTALVNNMSSMFNGCSNFNQPLSFNTSAVTTMSSMFSSATAFNQPLSFNTSAVTNMASMFNTATAFNQPLSFNTALVTNMGSMFQSATAFNSTLTFTSTALVNNMSSMFQSAIAFNQPLSFNTGAVTTMASMFQTATAFNQPLSFNTGAVTSMSSMFNFATAFNQNLGALNVALVTNFSNFMATKTPATFSTANLDAIYNGWVTVQSSRTITFNTAKYSAAGTPGKNYLTGTKLWIIFDGGL